MPVPFIITPDTAHLYSSLPLILVIKNISTIASYQIALGYNFRKWKICITNQFHLKKCTVGEYTSTSLFCFVFFLSVLNEMGNKKLPACVLFH